MTSWAKDKKVCDFPTYISMLVPKPLKNILHACNQTLAFSSSYFSFLIENGNVKMENVSAMLGISSRHFKIFYFLASFSVSSYSRC